MSAVQKTVGAALLLGAVSACSATEEEVGRAVGFALATEVLRQTPAVQQRFDGTAAPTAAFADVRNAGNVDYTGQIALYDDQRALLDAGMTELVTPEIIGRMDISTNIGATNGTFIGEGTNFTYADGEALTGDLALEDGTISVFSIIGRGEVMTLEADLSGSLTDEDGSLPYNTGVGGNFADAGESLILTGGTDGADNDGNSFATVIGAVRND
ncbi:hypothetical protein [Yoonia sp. 208BN28-4]|uniref:hypothetical protein n=1 Tax=Yoonia sp. 208BN28-4 TaxID=3126505 RepID=UPI0030AAE996